MGRFNKYVNDRKIYFFGFYITLQSEKRLKCEQKKGGLLSKEIKPHLRLIQVDNVSKIKNKYDRLKYISKEEMTLLWNIYWNFVLNDFRFEDKTKKYTVIKTVIEVEPEHIGMKMLKEITN